MRAELVRYVFAVWTVLMCAMITAPAASAERITVSKKDSKFEGTITTRTKPIGSFVSDVELRFVWSAIFDQPTEYYVFKWNRNPSYQWGNLSRNSLEKYPDLLARYDGLRPSNVKLNMQVKFEYKNPWRYSPCGIGLSYRTGFCRGGLSKTITDTPHLMIVRSGRLGDNMTPTSPKDDWVGFFDKDQYRGDSETLNTRLHHVMKYSQELEVYNLGITYDTPKSQLDSIFNEFLRRESKEDLNRKMDAFSAKLDALEAIEKSAGKNNPKILAQKITTLNELGQYEKAKQNLDLFRTLNPSEEYQREIAAASVNIERKFEEMRPAREAREAAKKAKEAEAREALRIAPFLKAENEKKSRLLSKNKFTGTSYLSQSGSRGRNGDVGILGRRGDNGKQAHNFNWAPGQRQVAGANFSGGKGGEGGYGADGSSGKDAGTVYLTVIEEPMSYASPFGLVIAKDSKGKVLSKGYWDFAKPLNINLSGGSGGNGGKGGEGGQGGWGASGSYESTRYATAGAGGTGGNGGGGGNGGDGGNGGNAYITLAGSADFVSKLKPRINVNVDGGSGGKGGASGRGGDGGPGGTHANGTKAIWGNRGYSGKRGKTGSTGKQGTVSYKQVSLADFRAMNPNRNSTPPKTETQAPSLSKKDKINRLNQVYLDRVKEAQRMNKRNRPQLEKACVNGSAESCVDLGELMVNIDLFTVEFTNARRVYKQACDWGNAEGCAKLASMIYNGRGGEQDKFKAGKISEQSCQAGSVYGCYLLAVYKRSNGGELNKIEAKKLHEQNCDAGYALSCYHVATMWSNGEGGTKDYTKSKLFYKKSCELGDSASCNNIANMFAKGIGGVKDTHKSNYYYRQKHVIDCNNGRTNSCEKLVSLDE